MQIRSQAAETIERLKAPRQGLFENVRSRLFEPVDIASIAIFRICFGAILTWEVWRFFENDWIRRYYIERDFYFKYFGFEWVHPWPGDGMYYHFLAVGFLAFCVMTGFLYRITSWLLFLGFSYWFLLDETRYLNHLYLTALLALLMAIIPAHRAKSIDAWFRPRIRSDSVPTWCLWLLRTQVGLVYFFAGVAKVNSDWLVGEPIRRWLTRRSDYPLIGPLFETEGAAWFCAYSSLFLDLLAAPALLWRPTRPWAFAACLTFHVSNKIMFDIGIFPVMMIAATLLMFPPDWPRKVCLFFTPLPTEKQPFSTTLPPRWARRTIEVFLVAYLSIQILLPLRHFAYPGNVSWTEEGHRFAWHMKLREKDAEVLFFATDPATGETWRVDHTEMLSTRQSDKVGCWPDMCLQFAHHLAAKFRAEGKKQIEIRVLSRATLNGRPPQFLIDPNVDLSKEKRSLQHATWIVPLYTRLPRP